METKLFELRDRGTFIPLLCIKPQAASDFLNAPLVFETKMAWRYGYKDSRAVIALHMGEPTRAVVDPHDWRDRTFQTAHCWIEEHWDELKSGDLIDVRFILGESIVPCESEA